MAQIALHPFNPTPRTSQVVGSRVQLPTEPIKALAHRSGFEQVILRAAKERAQPHVIGRR
jgi:hypothetical protein